jgi:hypothetical protein
MTEQLALALPEVPPDGDLDAVHAAAEAMRERAQEAALERARRCPRSLDGGEGRCLWCGRAVP